MKKAALITLSVSLIFSCQTQKRMSGYTINGVARNIPDNAVVILSINDKSVDSTTVMGEKFKLKGKVDNTTKATLKIKNTEDSKTFWLENNKIDFTAEKGDFKNVIINGSQTQKDNDILKQRLEPIEKQLEKMTNDKYVLMSPNFADSLNKVFISLDETQNSLYKEFIEEYPNSVFSAYILEGWKSNWGKETTKKLFSLMNKETQASSYGKLIEHFIGLKDLQVGDKYVDFELEDLNGEKIKLSDMKAPYILVEFWASWCVPCRASTPALKKDYQLYNKKGLEIIGVSLDDNKEDWLKAMKEDSLPWQNVIDIKKSPQQVSLIYGVSGIPDNVIINREGIIIARTLRGKKLQEKLKELFTP